MRMSTVARKGFRAPTPHPTRVGTGRADAPAQYDERLAEMTDAERYAVVYAMMGRSHARQAIDGTLGANNRHESVDADSTFIAERMGAIRAAITDADARWAAECYLHAFKEEFEVQGLTSKEQSTALSRWRAWTNGLDDPARRKIDDAHTTRHQTALGAALR